MADLVLDFEENAWRIGGTLKDADEVIEAAQILLDVNSAAEGRAIGLDSLNYLLQGLSIMPTYQPVTRTWDDILGAGELQTLSNPDIRMLLAEFESAMHLVEIVSKPRSGNWWSCSSLTSWRIWTTRQSRCSRAKKSTIETPLHGQQLLTGKGLRFSA